MSKIKRYLNLYLDRDSMLKGRDEMITKCKGDPTLKYSDTFIQTKDLYMEFMVVKVDFPLANFGGFDKVNCQAAIDKFYYIIEHLEELSKDMDDVQPEELPSTKGKPDEEGDKT